jgi:hypothetical protein
MVAMISPGSGIERGNELIDFYQGEPFKALLAAAHALHVLPKQGAIGPAFRDLAKPLAPHTLFGAILTDIRDFLKLRFRARGLTNSEPATLEAMLENLKTGHLPAEVEPGNPTLVVNYGISALDALSRDREGTREDFVNACRQLRDLFRATSKLLNPVRRSWSGWDDFEEQTFFSET